MQIEFVTDGLLAPSSRYRCEQFFPYFEKEGIRCILKYGYGTLYNTAVNRRWGGLYKLACRLRRGVWQMLPAKETDIIFLQRTALPHFPVFEQALATLDIPTIFDFDDSLTLNGVGERSLLRDWTFRKATKVSDRIIAGNDYLLEMAGYPTKTSVIPTVIDTEKFYPTPRNNSKLVIGWMGTSGNFLSLRPLVPALLRVLAKHPEVVVRIVSNSVFVPLANHPQVEQIQWSPDTEVELVRSFDIGLMPLIDAPVTRGKCAFKMIQYMSVESPVVVSKVGANIEVFGQGPPPGMIVDSFDWTEQISELIGDQHLRREMGANGRQRVVSAFSIQSVIQDYLELFSSLAHR